tara:strand:+ start:96 stop:764 length:669 start_codon:yes stop_codon:yes gene_type:complete
MPVVYFDDFVTSGYEAASANKFSRAADTSDWLLTQVGTATHAMTDDGVSAIKVGTGSTDNNTTNCQVNGEAFALASGKTLIWEMRCHIEDVTLTDWFVGVAISTTDILTACSDYIGFGNTANAASILAINGKDDTAEIADADSAGQTLTDTGSDLVNGTYVVLRFEVEGTSAVRFYVDGVLKATHTTDLPDNEAMSPAFAVRCASGAAEAITVDYVLAIIDR